MYRKLAKPFIYATLILITAVSLSMAGTAGRVVSVDDKGMATIEMSNGQTARVKVAGAQIGDKVDCSEKAGKISCKKAS